MSKRRRKKSWISWVLILILLIAAGVVCYLVWESYFKEKEVVSPVENNVTEVIEEEDVEVKPEEPEKPVEKEEIVQYEGENPNELNEITGAVTYAGVSGDKLMVRVNIDQYLNGGECMLLLSVAGNIVYSNVARVVDAASTATCEGFDVPVSLLETGDYEIVVRVEAGGKKGEIKGGVRI